jgi:hypothetical protein
MEEIILGLIIALCFTLIIVQVAVLIKESDNA